MRPTIVVVAEHTPTVSVVMIFLDEERFIGEAIASVLAQSLDSWELLLVDDGSSDGSVATARSHAERDPSRVRYLDHPGHRNEGMSATRNLGIANSRGTYVTFIDADDVWTADKLASQVAAMEANPRAGFVCGPTTWWHDWNPDREQADFVQDLGIALNRLHEPPSLLPCFLRDEWASLHDVLARRDLVVAVGGYEPSFRGMFEDQVFHAKLCMNAPAFVTRTSGHYYRQHPDACTAGAHREGMHRETRRAFLDWLSAYLAQHAPLDRAVRHEVESHRRALDPGVMARAGAVARRAGLGPVVDVASAVLARTRR